MADFKTEAEALDRLRRHVESHDGNVLVSKVRSRTGFAAARTADALSFGVWPSRGHAVGFYEIKCSRSDWLAELKNPAKAEEFSPYCNHIWIVAANKKIVLDGELPDGWGLIASHGNGLRKIVPAKKRTASPLPLEMLISVIVAERRQNKAAVCRAMNEGYTQGRKAGEDHMADVGRDNRDRADRLQAILNNFEKHSGLRPSNHFSNSELADMGERTRVYVQDGLGYLERYAGRIDEMIKMFTRTANDLRTIASENKTEPKGKENG